MLRRPRSTTESVEVAPPPRVSPPASATGGIGPTAKRRTPSSVPVRRRSGNLTLAQTQTQTQPQLQLQPQPLLGGRPKGLAGSPTAALDAPLSFRAVGAPLSVVGGTASCGNAPPSNRHLPPPPPPTASALRAHGGGPHSSRGGDGPRPATVEAPALEAASRSPEQHTLLQPATGAWRPSAQLSRNATPRDAAHLLAAPRDACSSSGNSSDDDGSAAGDVQVEATATSGADMALARASLQALLAGTETGAEGSVQGGGKHTNASAHHNEALEGSLPHKMPHSHGPAEHSTDAVSALLERCAAVATVESADLARECCASLPFYSCFRLVATPADAASGRPASLRWCPRADVLCRTLQFIGTMGYREDVFASVVDDHHHADGPAARELLALFAPDAPVPSLGGWASAVASAPLPARYWSDILRWGDQGPPNAAWRRFVAVACVPPEEARRWFGEQEFWIAALLQSLQPPQPTTADDGEQPGDLSSRPHLEGLLGGASPDVVAAAAARDETLVLRALHTTHPAVVVCRQALLELPQWPDVAAFARTWVEQARLVLCAACDLHQRVLAPPKGGPGPFLPCEEPWAALFGDTGGVAGGPGTFRALSSDVECGNIAGQAERYDPPSTVADVSPVPLHLLRAQGDRPTHDCKKVWFRFSVVGAAWGAPLSFRLLNVAPHTRLYGSGMRPVFCVGTHVVGQRAPRWSVAAACTFACVRDGAEGELSFTLPLPPPPSPQPLDTQCRLCASAPASKLRGCEGCRRRQRAAVLLASVGATVHVAFCEPYGYGDLLAHITLWHHVVKASRASMRYEERILARSCDGRKLHLLIISSPQEASGKAEQAQRSERAAARRSGQRRAADADVAPCDWAMLAELAGFYGSASSAPPPSIIGFADGKKVVLLSGRVHPSEVTGTYALHGAVQFLLSHDPRAALLRDNFIFFIVPMLNPDGVARGHSRLDQHGFNLNRCYSAPSASTQPTVLALRNVFEYLRDHYKGRFLCYLDFHSHASQQHAFVFGNHHPPAQQLWNVLFPRLIEAHSGGLFDMGICHFSKAHMASKDGTSRVLFGASLVLAFTVELSHFARMPPPPTAAEAQRTGMSPSMRPSATVGPSAAGAYTVPLNTEGVHEDWSLVAEALHGDGPALWTRPRFTVLRQSAEVGRACLWSLLDLCAVEQPPPAPSRGTGGRARSFLAAVASRAGPSAALARAGGMERLLRDARRDVTKGTTPASASNFGNSSVAEHGKPRRGTSTAPKRRSASAGVSSRPSWNASSSRLVE